MTDLIPLDIPHLLKKYDLHASKGLGQNFLVDEKSLESITRLAQIQPSDTVLEIGAGLGSLTRHLALAARSVVAVELDARLFPVLQGVLEHFPNVRLVEGDILKLNPQDLVTASGFVVVANIPYYITSAVIRHLLESNPCPRQLTLTIQQEVAERICALPGEMSLLALSVQVFGRPRLLAHIPSRAFYPVPKVDSAVLGVEIYAEPVISPALLGSFFSLARAGFSQKRKKLRNSLSAGMRLSVVDTENLLAASGIDPQRRAETLSLPDWAALTSHYCQPNGLR